MKSEYIYESKSLLRVIDPARSTVMRRRSHGSRQEQLARQMFTEGICNNSVQFVPRYDETARQTQSVVKIKQKVVLPGITA
jgi:hypothetical protein